MRGKVAVRSVAVGTVAVSKVAAIRTVGLTKKFGELSLYPKPTGRQTIDYFAGIRGGVDMAFVGELAERLDADLSRKVSEYSTGNRQKIGLIQAFIHKP